MKNIKQRFTVTLPEKQGYMDLTEDVLECIRRSNVRNGICTVASRHTTASVFTATNDDEQMRRYIEFYDKLTTLAEEDIRPALKHQLMGNGVTIPVIDGEADLGYTQFVMYIDFDGEREKIISVNIFGE